jgi:Fur family ferric uptake transcriptional regulator
MKKEVYPLENSLTSRGLKNTREREMILREVESRKAHFNAEELYNGLRRKGAKVSRPTIYRTLKLLDNFHLVKRFNIWKNCNYYEFVRYEEDHGHLICEQCGRVIDFPCRSLDSVKSEIAKHSDFEMDHISIQAFGRCRKCQKASTDGPRT